MSNKFEYHLQNRLNLDPLRATCLRYAKTFSKVEHQFQNKVFFQFDSEGVLLKALDRNSLNIAQKQFMQLSKVNQIEILTYNIDEEEYKQVIQRDIKNSNKYSKCFMQLITYEAFKSIAQQLKNFGYEEPMKLYEKYMKSHPKFSFLLCNEQQFQSVKADLLKLFKGRSHSSSSTVTQNQLSSSSHLSTQSLGGSSQQAVNYGNNKDSFNQSQIQQRILQCGFNGSIGNNNNSSIQKSKSDNTYLVGNKGALLNQNKNMNAHQQQQINTRQTDSKQQKINKINFNNQQNQQDQYTKVEYVKKEKSNKSQSELCQNNNYKINNNSINNNNNKNNNFDSNDSINNEVYTSDEERSNSCNRQNSKNNQRYRNIYQSNDRNNRGYPIQSQSLNHQHNYNNQKSYFIKRDLQSYSKTGTDTTTTGSHHELDGNVKKQEQNDYDYDDQDEYYENTYDDQNEFNKINDSADLIDTQAEESNTNYNFQNEFQKVYQNGRGNHHKKNIQNSSNSSGVSSRTPSLSRSAQNESHISVESEDSNYSYKEYMYPEEEQDIQKYQQMNDQEKSQNFYNLFQLQSKLLQEEDENKTQNQSNQYIDRINNESTASSSSSSSSSSSPATSSLQYPQQQQLSPNTNQIVILVSKTVLQEVGQSTAKQNKNVSKISKQQIIDSSSCNDLDGSIGKMQEVQELINKGNQVILLDPLVYMWLFVSGRIKLEKEIKFKIFEENKKIIAIEGIDQDLIKIASCLSYENLQRIATNNIDQLKQNERFIDLKNKFEISSNQEGNDQAQNLSKQTNQEEEQDESKKILNKLKSKSKGLIMTNKILELVTFEQFKEYFKKFKVKPIIKMCAEQFKLINPKDKQKGCVLFLTPFSQQQQKLTNEDIIKEISCKIESIFCSIVKLQMSKQIVDQTKPYYQYRQFDIKDVRKVSSLNDAETAFIAEYKYQTYCLKQYLKLNDKKLNKIIANYHEQAVADNPQFTQIYAISVVTKGQDQKEKELYVLSELMYMNLKNALDDKVLKAEIQQVEACIQLVNALFNLHSKNIDDFKLFHGNLKPTNVLFDENLSLYLSDVNLDPIGCPNTQNYKSSQSSSTSLTFPIQNISQNLNEKMMGMPQSSSSNLISSLNNSFNNSNNSSSQISVNQNFYCAPELFKSDQKLNKPSTYSDIWSLGLLLYEILQGASLKIDNKKKIKKLQYEHFSKNLIGMKNIIQKCLSKEPQQRPSCEEILSELIDIQKALNNQKEK